VSHRTETVFSPLTYADKLETSMNDWRMLGLMKSKVAKPVVSVPIYPPASPGTIWNDPIVKEALNDPR
jgi:hypothetical protein